MHAAKINRALPAPTDHPVGGVRWKLSATTHTANRNPKPSPLPSFLAFTCSQIARDPFDSGLSAPNRLLFFFFLLEAMAQVCLCVPLFSPPERPSGGSFRRD